MDNMKFSFELVDRYKPNEVLEMALKQVEDATRGFVKGNIQDYDGPMQDYLKKNGWAETLGSLVTASDVTVSIQDSLGEQGTEKHKYEVYLTVDALLHYQYRIMFLEYGTISYPAKVVMNDNLAAECFGNFKNKFEVESMAEMENMIDTILSSDVMNKLIQNLINESLRQKLKSGEVMIEDKNDDASEE